MLLNKGARLRVCATAFPPGLPVKQVKTLDLPVRFRSLDSDSLFPLYTQADPQLLFVRSFPLLLQLLLPMLKGQARGAGQTAAPQPAGRRLALFEGP